MCPAAWSLDIDLGSGRKETVIKQMQRNPAKEQERHPSTPGQLQKIGVYRELSCLAMMLSLPLSGRAIMSHKQRPGVFPASKLRR